MYFKIAYGRFYVLRNFKTSITCFMYKFWFTLVYLIAGSAIANTCSTHKYNENWKKLKKTRTEEMTTELHSWICRFRLKLKLKWVCRHNGKASCHWATTTTALRSYFCYDKYFLWPASVWLGWILSRPNIINKFAINWMV